MFEWVQTVQTFKVEICIYDIVMMSQISFMESYLLKLRYFHIIVIWRSNRSNVQSYCLTKMTCKTAGSFTSELEWTSNVYGDTFKLFKGSNLYFTMK